MLTKIKGPYSVGEKGGSGGSHRGTLSRPAHCMHARAHGDGDGGHPSTCRVPRDCLANGEGGPCPRLRKLD